jgi:hypothetical protein
MLHRSAAPSNKFDSGGKVLHLIFASLVIVIVANVAAVIAIAAMLTRFRKIFLGKNEG